VPGHQAAELPSPDLFAVQLRAVMEHIPDSIYFKDRNSRFVAVNEAAARWFGFRSPAELIGRTDFDLFTADHARPAFDDEQRIMATGVPIVGQVERETWPDGRVTWVSTSKMPLRDLAGEVIGTFGISRDITRQVQAEESLREARDAAEAASRAKSAFVANMSHEIRTPLNAVIGLTELLLETPLDAVQTDYLQTVLESGESLLSLLNDVLDFSKIESGRFQLESRPFEVRELVGSTLKSLGVKAHRKGIELAWEVAPEVPAAASGDPVRFRQVLVNLVGNAIKFTEHGEVVVSVLSVRGPDPVTLQVEVRDTGIGIPADRLQAIFEQFVQADHSTTRKYGGNGLGLAISARLVEMMGGRLQVYSEIGVGSRFVFTIDLQPAPADWLPPRVAEISRLCQAKVLICDDNATNRRILLANLRGWGLHPIEAESGREALALFARENVESDLVRLVISDVHMPEMDGFELVSRIQGSADVPIILLTSALRAEEAPGGLVPKVAAQLSKPVKQSELLSTIVEVLTHDATLPAPPAAPRPRRPLNKQLRILVAEDSLPNQKLALGLLKRWGHTADVVDDGRKALEAWRRGEYDLILMDVEMPELDGLAATRAIRLEERTAQTYVPIIAMTAKAMAGDREQCLQAGMDAYVSKPIRQAAFEAVLESLSSES
jgi:PAS domain S-box-containing protein